MEVCPPKIQETISNWNIPIDPQFKPPIINNINANLQVGLNDFEESSMIYKIKIVCKPEYRYSVKREANRIIKIWLDRNHISIPYPQITIHRGNT